MNSTANYKINYIKAIKKDKNLRKIGRIVDGVFIHSYDSIIEQQPEEYLYEESIQAKLRRNELLNVYIPNLYHDVDNLLARK